MSQTVITITATSQTVAYGSNISSLTYTYSPESYDPLTGNTLITVSNSGSEISSTYTSSSDVGSYPITFVQGDFTLSDTINYSLSFVTGTITVVQATPTFTWTPSSQSIIYGSYLQSNQLNAQIPVDPNSNLSIGTVAYALSDGTPVSTSSPYLTLGVHNIIATLTVSDSNYNTPSTSSVQFTVIKETPTLSWTPSSQSIIYGSYLQTGQLNAQIPVDPITGLAIGTVAYALSDDTPVSTSTYIPSGANTIIATLNITDTNYNNIAPVQQVFTVSKATPTITWTPSSQNITYGTYLQSNQLNIVMPIDPKTSLAIGTVAYALSDGTVVTTSTYIPAGANTIIATLNITDTNYNSVDPIQKIFTVSKATPTLTWTPSSQSITYGTYLQSNQLNIVVPTNPKTSLAIGTISYALSNGTSVSTSSPYLILGSHDIIATLTVSDSNYNTPSTSTVQFTVIKAIPILTWTPSSQSITYGTYLQSNQLNAQIPVNPITGLAIGTLSYSLSDSTSVSTSTYIPAGSNTITAKLNVTDANYNSASPIQQVFTVSKATPILTWNPSTQNIIYGSYVQSNQLNIVVPTDPKTSLPIGTVSYALSDGSSVTTSSPYLTLGVHDIIATLTVSDSNYNTPSTTTVQFTVIKATPTLIWTPSSQSITYGSYLQSNQLNSQIPLDAITGLAIGTMSYALSDGTSVSTSTPYLTLGVHNIIATLTITDTNYNNPSTSTVQFTVIKATPTLIWTPSSQSITYGQYLQSNQLNAQIPLDTITNVPIGTMSYALSDGTSVSTSSPYLTYGNHNIIATLTITDSNYNTPSSKTIQFTVSKIASPTFTWTVSIPSSIYGTLLSSSQLNSIFVDPIDGTTPMGTITYSTIVGSTLTYISTSYNLLPVGTYTVTAKIVINNQNYIATTQQYTNPNQLTINLATSPTFTWTSSIPSSIYGSSLLSSQLNSTFIDPIDGITPMGTITYSTTVNSSLVTLTTGYNSLPVGNSPYSVIAYITTTNPNYSPSTQQYTNSNPLIINRATPIFTWTTPLASYTYGTPLPSAYLNAVSPTDIITGSNIGSITSYSKTSGDILPAGTAGTNPITATLNVTSPNYVLGNYTATNSTLVVNKLTATSSNISWNPTSTQLTFEDQLTTSSHLNSQSLDLIDNSSSIGTFTYTATSNTTGITVAVSNGYVRLQVDTYTIKATMSTITNPNYVSPSPNLSLSKTFTVIQEHPNFTWTTHLTSYVYGTPLLASYLNAVSPVDPVTGISIGSITYSLASGIILPVGVNTITAYLTVTSAPDYIPGTYSATNTITVTQYTLRPTFTWNSYLPPMPYGLPISSKQLNAIVSVDPFNNSLIIGNITYLPIQLGQILDAGNYIITAVLTITNPNYVARTYSITNTLKVMPIKPTITYYTPRPIVAGGHLSSLELDAQTNLPAANILYSVPLGTIINSRTAINAYLTPPYYNSNFLDEPVYTNVVLNII